MIKLKPYQVTAKTNVLEQWKNVNSTMLAMATGTGKTETFLSIIEHEYLHNPEFTRALIISHRQELVFSPVERAAKNWPKLPTIGAVMNKYNDSDAKIISACIATVDSTNRIEELLKHGSFSHLVIDECHHAVADTYKNLIKTLQIWNPNLKVLGVTATPKRRDGKGLVEVFQTVAYKLTLVDAIKLGALVPFSALGFALPVSLKDVKTVGSGDDEDFDSDEVSSILDVDNVNELVVETWEKYAKDRPTIIFSSSIQHAASLAESFRRRGFNFESVDYKTNKDFRLSLLKDMREGKLHGLSNKSVYVEGTDIPLLSCMINIAPTKSDSIYLQRTGRVLRTYPGKESALLLDFVPEDSRDMRLAGDLLGKPRIQRKKEEKAKKKGIILDCFGIDSKGSGIDGEVDDILVKVLDYFSGAHIAWTFDGKLATVTGGVGSTLAVIMPDLARVERGEKYKADFPEKWNLKLEQTLNDLRLHRLYSIVNYQVTLVNKAEDWNEINGYAEDWMYENRNESAVLAKKKAQWRREPATESQIKMCKQFGIWRDDLKKGSAAQAITHYMAMQQLKKKGLL